MVKRLNFIRRCRELGFTMNEIRELLAIVDGEHVSCKQIKKATDTHIQDVRLKIKGLKKLEQTLMELSNQCSGTDIPECPIIEALLNN
jgi:MerR family mercuric resistance operon transcriptional regulator